ncbi:MAG: hypothetical protein ABSB12_03355 [Candidatus Saccharimonadales bacterium]|jgi:hypothetical protein
MEQLDENQATLVNDQAPPQYQLLNYVDSFILVQNNLSTHGEEVGSEFETFLSDLGKPFGKVLTNRDPQITTQRIIEKRAELEAKYRELGRMALFFASGDKVIDDGIPVARQIGAVVCALKAGGASNRSRSLIESQTPEELFKNGYVVNSRTMVVELSNSDGELIDKFEAHTTGSLGYPVKIANFVNTPEHRGKTIFGVNIHKVSAALAAAPRAILEIKKAKKFTVEINGQEVRTRAILFLNCARFAIVGYAKQVRADGPIHYIEKSSRSLLGLGFTLIRLRAKHSPGVDLNEPLTIRFPFDTEVEFGGDTRKIAAGTIARLSHGLIISEITDKKDYLETKNSQMAA